MQVEHGGAKRSGRAILGPWPWGTRSMMISKHAKLGAHLALLRLFSKLCVDAFSKAPRKPDKTWYRQPFAIDRHSGGSERLQRPWNADRASSRRFPKFCSHREDSGMWAAKAPRIENKAISCVAGRQATFLLTLPLSSIGTTLFLAGCSAATEA